jgi:hypothetical protein
MIGVALLIGAISLCMGVYTHWMGPTDCRVLTTSHSAVDVKREAVRWVGMAMKGDAQ